jgi:hypothetical protein
LLSSKCSICVAAYSGSKVLCHSLWLPYHGQISLWRCLMTLWVMNLSSVLYPVDCKMNRCVDAVENPELVTNCELEWVKIQLKDRKELLITSLIRSVETNQRFSCEDRSRSWHGITSSPLFFFKAFCIHIYFQLNFFIVSSLFPLFNLSIFI